MKYCLWLHVWNRRRSWIITYVLLLFLIYLSFSNTWAIFKWTRNKFSAILAAFHERRPNHIKKDTTTLRRFSLQRACADIQSLKTPRYVTAQQKTSGVLSIFYSNLTSFISNCCTQPVICLLLLFIFMSHVSVTNKSPIYVVFHACPIMNYTMISGGGRFL